MVSTSSIWPVGQPYPPTTRAQQIEMAGPKMASGMHWTPEAIERYRDFLTRNADNFLSATRSRDIVGRAAATISGRSVLVYGSNPSFLLDELRRSGYSAEGTGSTHLATGPAYEAMIEGRCKFGVIIMTDLIERLYDRELGEALTTAHGLLEDDGRLIVITPFAENLDSEMVYSAGGDVAFHRLQHVRSWTEISLKEALQSNGYRIDRSETLNFRSNMAMRNPVTRIAASAWAAIKPPATLMVVASK
jgi:hypothetical protein